MYDIYYLATFRNSIDQLIYLTDLNIFDKLWKNVSYRKKVEMMISKNGLPFRKMCKTGLFKSH